MSHRNEYTLLLSHAMVWMCVGGSAQLVCNFEVRHNFLYRSGWLCACQLWPRILSHPWETHCLSRGFHSGAGCVSHMWKHFRLSCVTTRCTSSHPFRWIRPLRLHLHFPRTNQNSHFKNKKLFFSLWIQPVAEAGITVKSWPLKLDIQNKLRLFPPSARPQAGNILLIQETFLENRLLRISKMFNN